jgi:hypothetical protein
MCQQQNWKVINSTVKLSKLSYQKSGKPDVKCCEPSGTEQGTEEGPKL